MTQQKSEDRLVPHGGVMPVQPGDVAGQGKAVPVDQEVRLARGDACGFLNCSSRRPNAWSKNSCAFQGVGVGEFEAPQEVF
jgi:hypothetical protein